MVEHYCSGEGGRRPWTLPCRCPTTAALTEPTAASKRSIIAEACSVAQEGFTWSTNIDRLQAFGTRKPNVWDLSAMQEEGFPTVGAVWPLKWEQRGLLWLAI